MSALGLSKGIKPAPWPLRLAAATLMRAAATDKQHSEALIQRSTLSWTLVLPGPLSNEPPTRKLIATTIPASMARIPRGELAAFLVNQAESMPAAGCIVTVERRAPRRRLTQ